MALGSSSPRIRPSHAASRCARRALARRENRELGERAGGPEVVELAEAIVRRDPVSAPKILGLIHQHETARERARKQGRSNAKSLELYALLGGAAMHREAYRAVQNRPKATKP